MAGRDDFHVSSARRCCSGTRSTSSSATVNGPTSDQVVAAQLAGSTTFKSLVYRVQAAWYLSVSAPYGRDLISYKSDSTGRVVPVPAEVSPRQAFTQLFGNFVPPGVESGDGSGDGLPAPHPAQRARPRPPADNAAASAARTRRSSCACSGTSTRSAISSCGSPPSPPPQTGTCVKPADPGPDPALGGNQGLDGSGNTTYGQNLGYCDEEDRAKTFVGLIHMAMVCDLTRVASLQLTLFQSHMNMFSLTGQGCDLHEVGHFGAGRDTTTQMAKGQAWHVKHFA